LNLNQKLVVIAGLVGVLLVILFPPFQVKMLGAVAQNGHHFILDPPNSLAKVDGMAVVVRSVVIAVAAAIGYVALAERSR